MPQAGKTTVENNSLGDIAQAQSEGKSLEQKAEEHIKAENERYQQENCAGMSAEACSVQMYNQRREELKKMLSTGADFVPAIGDMKSFAEAESYVDYLAAVVGLIPGAGKVAGKAIKAAEIALKKGDLARASKLANKASDEISTVIIVDEVKYPESAKHIEDAQKAGHPTILTMDCSGIIN